MLRAPRNFVIERSRHVNFQQDGGSSSAKSKNQIEKQSTAKAGIGNFDNLEVETNKSAKPRKKSLMVSNRENPVLVSVVTQRSSLSVDKTRSFRPVPTRKPKCLDEGLIDDFDLGRNQTTTNLKGHDQLDVQGNKPSSKNRPNQYESVLIDSRKMVQIEFRVHKKKFQRLTSRIRNTQFGNFRTLSKKKSRPTCKAESD